jgi:catechol 2,3-dioxygenase-like lactoylglutathione lyase family enzyme
LSGGAETGIPSSRYDHEPIRHTATAEGIFCNALSHRKGPNKSKEFYVGVLGGKIVKKENPCYIKLANSWIVLNSGGGPTPDKPDVWLAPPHDLNSVSSFLNLGVADIHACYEDWSEKGAQFLTEPLDNRGHELRCYMRDPDGYLIEVGQPSQAAIDAFKKFAG